MEIYFEVLVWLQIIKIKSEVIDVAKSADEGVVLKPYIVLLVEVVSVALVHVATTAVENVVGRYTRISFSVSRVTANSDTIHLKTLACLFV